MSILFKSQIEQLLHGSVTYQQRDNRAIVFGNWLHENCFPGGNGKWFKTGDTTQAYTTEELYQLFLKSPNQ